MFKEKSRILFQGDSITDCGRSRETKEANTALGAGYANMIASDLLAAQPEKKFSFFNRGVIGNRVVDLYARWKIDCLNLEPDVLSIYVGVNDIWHEFNSKNGVEPERFDQFYRMLLDWTRHERRGIEIILIEPFVLLFEGVVGEQWLPVIKIYQQLVRKIAADYKLRLIALQDIFSNAAKKAPVNHWVTDGVHPTQAGHRLIADAWKKARE